MALPTAMVPYTMIGCRAFGRMCRNMIRSRPAPRAVAASTYSSWRSDRKLERTMRQMASHPVSPRTTITVFSPRPRTVAMATARMM
jgi:hypothetical protein